MKSIVSNFSHKNHKRLAVLVAAAFVVSAVSYAGCSAASSSAAAEAATDSISSARNTPAVYAAKTVGPAVVGITNKAIARDWFDNPVETEGVGSGVIFKSDGYIVTNNHVINGAKELIVSLSDGRSLKGKVIGADEVTDLAVIKIDAKDLPTATFADSDQIVVGEPAIAIGNPMGLEFRGSVTSGVVSALNRTLDNSDSRVKLLQTDAAINPGNSGGALVNDNGELVGINSLIESYSGSSSGVGFAIPVNYAKNIADQIIDGKTPVHPYMGATLSSVNALNARTNKLSTDSGAYVASVVEDGPAAKAGIQEGDVITKLGDDEITSADGLIIALRSHEVGEKVEITLMRGKDEKKVTVELGSDEELQNQQQNDSATDTGNGGITDEQLRQYLEELLGQQGQGQGYGQGY